MIAVGTMRIFDSFYGFAFVIQAMPAEELRRFRAARASARARIRTAKRISHRHQAITNAPYQQ